jgi:ribosomal protein L30E
MIKDSNKKKIWKKITKIGFRNTNETIKYLKKKKFVISLWVEDIFKKKIIYKKYECPIYFYKIKVRDLGIKKPSTLEKIYREIKNNNFQLVNPEFALLLRILYKNQKKGEWLRIATPFNSMIDKDKVPHLPKLGKALNKYFIETYWSYKKAIFHPHNEFVVMKKN